MTRRRAIEANVTQNADGTWKDALDAERFCARCGAPIGRREEGGRERPWCPACGHVVFGR